MPYKLKNDFDINCGFQVNISDINYAINSTNTILSDLPSTLYKSIDYKTTSAMIGAIFCDTLASRLPNAMVNPIEKGHPDIIPISAKECTEEQLRKYPYGLEIKCTVGNIQTGANLRAGQSRIDSLTGITWQAHHREVEKLLGLIWDFVEDGHSFNFPKITGAFYATNLTESDWGAISGTTGRNTKVSGMTASGKAKMGNGWISVVNQPNYLTKYQKYLNFSLI